jgi:1-deoxy-D-xylulose-5-phosphate reductoisomerase
MRRVALLGATGSIGRQAIEVVAAHPELELCALQSGSTPLDSLTSEHGVEHAQVGGDAVELLERCEPDVVLNAIVGFAGVGATLWALEHGVTLALANKESLVAAGELAIAARSKGEGLLLPVDSEHSALWQCLEGRPPESVAGLVLTASGGPFRGRSRPELVDVTPAEALAHPTWNMGPKITVDSATLANKGLELIEAHWLFDVGYDRIVGLPDMRVPISFALTHPDRAATDVPQLDLAGLDLSFEAPDTDAFPMLVLARAAGERGGTAPCAFNAANEVAVAAFLESRIGFLDITTVVEETLSRIDGAAARDLEDLVVADAEARRLAARGLQPA